MLGTLLLANGISHGALAYFYITDPEKTQVRIRVLSVFKMLSFFIVLMKFRNSWLPFPISLVQRKRPATHQYINKINDSSTGDKWTSTMNDSLNWR
jgi:hypothetical protein